MPEETRVQFEEQAPITIKSGQIPPMYADLHWSNWTDRIQTWSVENVKPVCIEEKTMIGGKRKGKSFRVVHRHMKSLQKYGFKKYKSYSGRELRIYRPSTSWVLRVPGKGRLTKRYDL